MAGVCTPSPAPSWPIGQRGRPEEGGRGVQRAEEAGGAGGGQVVHRARLHVGDRDRKAVRVTDDLHVAAAGAVLARIPQVMTGIGVLHPTAVGGDERCRRG